MGNPSSKPRDFHVMAKPSSFHCNIQCSYCFYLQKEALFSRQARFMSEETLKQYIQNYIQSQSGQQVDFAWQGGEPSLLGLDFFRKAVYYQQVFAEGKTITNSFQTNGIALNRQWAEFFKQHRFLLGISVDGLSEVHNQYRISVNGRPTFERVAYAIELLKEYQVEFNTLTVVNDQNWDKGLATYQALKQLGAQYMQFIPVVELANNGATCSTFKPSKLQPIAPFSVPPQGYGRFLLDIFHYWVRFDVGRIFVREFDNLLGQWLGFPSSSCIHSPTCGTAVVLEANGDVYSCDHFVYPAYKLGNIHQAKLIHMLQSKKQIAFGKAKQALSKPCEKCDVRLICHGGCPKQRLVAVTGEKIKQNYLCPSYQLFFRQTAPLMHQMSHLIRCGGTADMIMPLLHS